MVKLPNEVTPPPHGTLPDEFIQRFVTRRAFVYMLEILAAVIVAFLRAQLPKFFTMLVDNQPGKSALQKDYGKDQRVSAIIAAFWSLAPQH